MQEWYLGWEKVSCLERCPQFRSVFIERGSTVCTITIKDVHLYSVYLGTETLGTQNAALIKKELRPAQKMAYELGLALKVPVTDDLSQVVDEFLQLSAPTWATIVDALRSPAVKCDRLAQFIEERFCSKPPTGPAEGIMTHFKHSTSCG